MELALSKATKAIKEQHKTAFLSVIIMGLISQGMGLFNKFSYHDDIFDLFLTGSTIPSGRWMLYVVGIIEKNLFGDGHYSLPVMNGLFAICCVALSACLIVDMLRIRKKLSCFFLAAIMICFPTITGLFGYMFTMPYYLLSLLMITGAAWLLCCGKKWYFMIPAVLLGGCSVGIYQAFLPVLLGLIVLFDMVFLSQEQVSLPQMCKTIGKQAACVLGIMIFYFCMNQLFLWIYHENLTDYQGIDQMGSLTAYDFWLRILRAYREFFLPTRDVSFNPYPQHVFHLYMVMLVLSMLLVLSRVVSAFRDHCWKGILMLLLLLAVPLCSGFIFLMSEEVHGLMVYGRILPFLFFIWLMDQNQIKLPSLRQLISVASAAVLLLVSWMYARYDNQCYLKTELQQQAAISYYTTLITRIKSTEGYTDLLPICFVNEGKLEDHSLYNIDELNLAITDPYNASMTEYVNSYAWWQFMNRWCGFEQEYTSSGDIQDREEVKNMPSYPDDGSIMILDDRIVVKF